MSDFNELMRIADQYPLSDDDAKTIRTAAVKLIVTEPVQPRWQETKKVDGFGYITNKLF